MSTTFVSGTTITSTFLNQVAPICEDGSWGTKRQTMGDNGTYDIGATVATNVYQSASITIAGSKQYNTYTINPVYTLGAAAVGTGIVTQPSTSSSGAGSTLYGVIASPSASAGTVGVTGVYAGASSTGAGFTGTLTGFTAVTAVSAGSPAATYMANFQHSGSATAGLVINATNSGNTLGTGVAIGSNSEVTDAAFKWTQRNTGTNAGDLLQHVNGVGTVIYKIDKNGNPWHQNSAHRIYGDFSNASLSLRTSFQDKTVGNNSQICIVPNVSPGTAGILAANGTNMDEAGRISMSITSTTASINTTKSGAGVTLPLGLYANSIRGIEITNDGNVVTGSASLTRASTNGFLYIPKYNDAGGAPTGVPTAITGYSPMMANEATGIVYIYLNAAWRALN
jgi:hypothetical protein